MNVIISIIMNDAFRCVVELRDSDAVDAKPLQVNCQLITHYCKFGCQNVVLSSTFRFLMS